jgi:hypothetical protein
METMGSVGCNQIVDADEPCFDKQYGYSSDGKKMLECKDGPWALEMDCKSSKGCVENAEGVKCESAEAEEGDKCQQKCKKRCNNAFDKYRCD